MNTENDPPWRIPYGVADFIKLRTGHEYYVDKTHYLPLLEQAGRFLFLIRPRRFGKSLLQSVMECYYDAHWAERFDELFADTWIHAHPTAERGQYLCLRFDFSAVSSTPSEVRESFEAHTRIILGGVLERQRARLPAGLPERVMAETTLTRRLERLIDGLLACDLPLYLFIDEYDNFANNVLVNAGREAYRDLTHSSGFFRDFFALLKEAVGRTGSGLARLFITGVSPITLDDVTSGFNIGRNISLDPRFNALLGFTHAELEPLFQTFGQDFRAHRAIIDEWYNHYHFHKARREPIINSDMALYYLQSLVDVDTPPDDLIDHNVRIDYGKLRHLVQIDRQLADRDAMGGFVDLYLAPFYFRYPDMRHAYLIELKYLSRSDDRPAKRAQLLEDARAQLRRYAGDARIHAELGEATLHPIVLLYSGWELVHREAVAVALSHS